MLRALPALLFVALAALVSPRAVYAGECDAAEQGDPMRVYLLTLNPGDDLFSKIGHSALWVSGGRVKGDVVFNWGAYSSKRQDPVPAFLDGRMKYFLDLGPLTALESRAKRHHRTMVAQRLDLSEADLARLVPLLDEAAQPENRDYQYNWADSNCATRIRDLLDEVLQGELRRQLAGPAGTTWRAEVLRHLSAVPWAWFGWHFLAAAQADAPMSGFEELFTPDKLMDGLAGMSVDGRPLVSETCTLLEGPLPWPPKTAPVWWPWTGGIGLLWAVGIARGGRRTAGGLVALFGLFAGAMGSITGWLAATSAIEGLDRNVNWFVASPGTLLLVPAGIAVALGIQGSGRRVVAVLSAALAVVGLVGAVVGLFAVQDSAAIFAMFLPPLLATAWTARQRAA